MQTPSHNPVSARACTAPASARFRLPLTSHHRNWTGGIDLKSADGAYELNLYPSHGVKECSTQYWGYETRIDDKGRSWSCTTARYAVDDFGDLVEVEA